MFAGSEFYGIGKKGPVTLVTLTAHYTPTLNVTSCNGIAWTWYLLQTSTHQDKTIFMTKHKEYDRSDNIC